MIVRNGERRINMDKTIDDTKVIIIIIIII